MFRGNLEVKKFCQSDIDKFSDFLIIDEEFAMNTHAKSMMDLLQIIKYAVKLKKIPATKLVELEFDTRREETDSIYLTETRFYNYWKSETLMTQYTNKYATSSWWAVSPLCAFQIIQLLIPQRSETTA